MSLTAVTGASGFLGAHVVRHWHATGRRVRGLYRRPPAPGVPGEVVVVPDLLDSHALRTALEGADTVLHLAARVHVTRETATDPLAEFRQVNVEGTRQVLQAAVRAGARHFVLASSVKAMGEVSTEPWTEETVPHPVDPYGISKLEAEDVVQRLASTERMRASILRLPLVYGPGVGANMLRLLDAVHRGTPLPLGGLRNRRSLVFVGNVLAAIEAVLRAESAGGQVFLVSDRQDVSTPELVRLVAAAMGRPARLIPVPEVMLRGIGWAGDLLGKVLPVPIDSEVVQRLTGSLALDTRKLVSVTGYRPPYTPEEGMSATARWYLEQRLSMEREA